MLKEYIDCIDLSGIWMFGMGAEEDVIDLNETVKLPGSMDENQKGFDNTSNISTTYLNRDYVYSGAAIYQKKINIPSSWKGMHIELFLERTRKTRVWIDNELIEKEQQKSYVTPHVYDLTGYVKAGGNHTLKIEVDNSPKNLPQAMYTTFEKDFPWGHMVSEHTQTNWNGILGEISLRATHDIRIENFKIRANINKNLAKVSIKLIRDRYDKKADGYIELKAESYNSIHKHIAKLQSFPFFLQAGERESTLILDYEMGSDVLLWDEFNPSLYKMSAILHSEADGRKCTSLKEESFGMRKFEALYLEDGGKQFAINGRPTQLRGEINCAVFPMTGYAAMNLRSWLGIMGKYKAYGINHVRFHTWVPPKAAFIAADLTGLYVQFELPQWGHKMFGDIDKGDTSDRDYYWNETIKIFDTYLNSPSAVMMALGNELRPGFYYYDEFLKLCKEKEPQLLYTDIAGWCAYTENVDFSGSVPTKGEDFLHRVEPSTDWDHLDNTRKTPVPFLAHEAGQLQVFPDYNRDIQKYYERKSILKPRNLEAFAKILDKADLNDMAGKFNKSTAGLSFMLYRYMVESYLRTQGAGGFQLLGLQDFPGQGTALIGVLDSFMEEKPGVVPEEFRKSCSEFVLLARLPKFTWHNNENFSATTLISNYSAADITSTIVWKIMNQRNEKVAEGRFENQLVKQGMVTDIGRIHFSLQSITKAEKLSLHIEICDLNRKTAPYAIGSNEYPIWVYPAEKQQSENSNISIYNHLSKEAEDDLGQGKSVLIISQGTRTALPQSRAMTFRPDFWSPMFHSVDNDGYVLGCYIDSQHRVFKNFPTDIFADWQWFDLIQSKRCILLNNAPKVLKPIVQPIATIELEEKLGVLFEAKAGKGKVFISSVNLLDGSSIAAQQLLYSIKEYMGSKEFNPEAEVSIDYLRSIVSYDTKISENNANSQKRYKEHIPADKTMFFEVLSEAGNKNKEDYTLKSWEDFEKIYNQAKSFGALTNASQNEVDTITKKLQMKMNALRSE